MLDKKLLVLDVDGTLLGRDGQVHPDDAAAIARLLGAGVPVSIATGRLYSGTRVIARSVGISGPIACVDGAHIVDVSTDEERFANPLRPAAATAVRDAIGARALASFLFAQDGIVHDARGEPFAGYVRTWSDRIASVDRVVDHPHWEHQLGVMAVVAIGLDDDVRGAEADSAAHAPEALVVTFPVARLGGTRAMVVRARGATKGTAIAWLAAHHGVTPADVVVVGDWINDVSMFDAAGCSFVMGQAPAEVKAHATHELTRDAHTGGGVAEAIDRAFGL